MDDSSRRRCRTACGGRGIQRRPLPDGHLRFSAMPGTAHKPGPRHQPRTRRSADKLAPKPVQPPDRPRPEIPVWRGGYLRLRDELRRLFQRWAQLARSRAAPTAPRSIDDRILRSLRRKLLASSSVIPTKTSTSSAIASSHCSTHRAWSPGARQRHPDGQGLATTDPCGP